MVRWPWKEPRLRLPNNCGLSLKRLRSLANRLPEKNLTDRHDETIKEQVKKEIIKEVGGSREGPEYYISHHAVFTPCKSTAKLRVMYDASAKANKRDYSLNESLNCGY